MRSHVGVEFDDFVESIRPPPLFLIGLIEAFELPAQLRPMHLEDRCLMAFSARYPSNACSRSDRSS